MAEEVKHSPAPWHWNGNSLVSGKHGYYLMHTEECPGLGYSAEANKRLIAADPDLLQAAKEVLAGLHARIDAADGRAVPVFHGIVSLSDAINKAEGRS